MVIGAVRACRPPGTSAPTGSSGEIRPSVIARPKISAVTDFAIDQLS